MPSIVQGILAEPPPGPSPPQSVDQFGIPGLKPEPPIHEPGDPRPFREFSEGYRLVNPIDLSGYGIEQQKLYNLESTGDPFAYTIARDRDDPADVRSFIGLAQYGQELLAELGYYVDDNNLNDDKWTGHFVGLDGVYDYIDFMNSVAAQDEVYDAELARANEYLEGRGLDTYVGRTVQDILMTPSAIRFGAHIAGLSRMNAWLHGGTSPSDAFGANIPHHAKAGAEISPEELRTPGTSSAGWERPLRPGEFFLPIPSPLPEGRR